MAITPGPPGDDDEPDRIPDAAELNDDEPDRMWDATELAAFLGGKYTHGTITRSWREWDLPTHKIGRELRFRVSEVHQWLKDRKLN